MNRGERLLGESGGCGAVPGCSDTFQTRFADLHICRLIASKEWREKVAFMSV